MAGNDSQDQKDYQDYVEYQKYLGSGRQPEAPATPTGTYEQYYNSKYGKPNIAGSLENLAGAQLLGPAKSALGRALQNAGVSGARAAGDTPGGIGDKAASGGLAALLGGGLSAAGEGIAAGGNKLADYLMQKAAGMRKLTPGAGNRLVDQGLIGTRGMLANQVEEKLPQAEQAVQSIVSGLPDQANPSEIAAAVAKRGDKFVLPNGEIPANVQADASKVQSAAKGLSQLGGYEPAVPPSSQEVQTGISHYGEPQFQTVTSPGSPEKPGSLSMQDVLKLKRQGDWVGYTNSGNPASSLDSELGRAQADKAREILSAASGGKSAEALSDEQALILAKKALTKPETIHQGMGSTMFFGKYPGQSLVGSTAAQALQKVIAPTAKTVVDPRILPSLFSR